MFAVPLAHARMALLTDHLLLAVGPDVPGSLESQLHLFSKGPLDLSGSSKKVSAAFQDLLTLKLQAH